MKRRQVLWALLGFSALAHPAHSQSAKPRLVGLLDAGDRHEWWATFRQQMRELGYVEGRDVAFEGRYAAGKPEPLPRMAEELVKRKVDVIVTSGTVAASAAKRVTDTVPIVIATGTDPVSLGLAKSLSRPGENVTGMVSLSSDLTLKRFALLREIFPGIGKVAVIWHRDNTPSAAAIRDLLSAADAAKISLQNLPLKDAAGVEQAIDLAMRDRAQALIVVQGPLIYRERKKIADLALRNKLPTMNGAAEYVDAGGLVSYAPSYPEFFRRAAVYVDRIFKGANPAELPFELPSKFELVLNQKTASAIGVTIPAAVAARADRVVGAL